MAKAKYEINFFGLDNSGKSTMIQTLVHRGAQLKPLLPTKGFDFQTYNLKLQKGCCKVQYQQFSLVDTGGQQSVRDFWPRLYKTGAGIIFILDASDNVRYEESFSEIRKLLADPIIMTKPFMIYANKQDLQCNITSVQQFKQIFGDYNGYFQAGNALDFELLEDQLSDFLVKCMNPEQLKITQQALETPKMTVEEKFAKLESLQRVK